MAACLDHDNSTAFIFLTLSFIERFCEAQPFANCLHVCCKTVIRDITQLHNQVSWEKCHLEFLVKKELFLLEK